MRQIFFTDGKLDHGVLDTILEGELGLYSSPELETIFRYQGSHGLSFAAENEIMSFQDQVEECKSRNLIDRQAYYEEHGELDGAAKRRDAHDRQVLDSGDSFSIALLGIGILPNEKEQDESDSDDEEEDDDDDFDGLEENLS
jgi:hypothetical protein